MVAFEPVPYPVNDLHSCLIYERQRPLRFTSLLNIKGVEEQMLLNICWVRHHDGCLASTTSFLSIFLSQEERLEHRRVESGAQCDSQEGTESKPNLA